MRIIQQTLPGVEPISLSDLKNHLRITDSDDNLYLLSLISAAREYGEKETELVFIRRSFRLYADSFVPGEWCLDVFPLQTVTAINYRDINGGDQVFDPLRYRVDTITPGGRLAPVDSWPSVASDSYNNVWIDFDAGYGLLGGAVPLQIRQALLMLCGHWYENRESSSLMTVKDVPLSTMALLQGFSRKYHI